VFKHLLHQGEQWKLICGSRAESELGIVSHASAAIL
jgi:hypothetical protein